MITKLGTQQINAGDVQTKDTKTFRTLIEEKRASQATKTFKKCCCDQK